jgi:hypothetical protein
MATNLFEMSRGGPYEDYGEITCGGGGDCRQPRAKEEHRNSGDGLFSSQRRVHI